MELYKKIGIQILSAESPGKFWFRTKQSENKLIANIEAYMKSHRNSKNICSSISQLNDMVIVKSDGKFEIAQIKNIDKELDIFSCLSPNGIVRKLTGHDILPLKNQNLANEAIETILIGSIVGVVPAKMVSKKTEMTFFLKQCAFESHGCSNNISLSITGIQLSNLVD